MQAKELMTMIEEGKASHPSAEQVLLNQANYDLLRGFMRKDRYRGKVLCDLEVDVMPDIPDNRVYMR